MRNPRHILITGSSSGIGAALAVLYAAPGIRLSLHGRDAARLAAVAESAGARGADVAVTIGDVTDAGAVAAWVAGCDAAQPIDLVIANAGISLGKQSGESAAESRAMFAVNVSGVLNTVHPALPLMEKRRRGQIALVSSLAGFRGIPRAPSYSAGKAAIRVYGEALRTAMKPHGIEVNVVCPGFIATLMTRHNPFPMPLLMPAEKAARIIQAKLSDNCGRIAFPWPMYLLVALIAALPNGLAERLMAYTPRKSA